MLIASIAPKVNLDDDELVMEQEKAKVIIISNFIIYYYKYHYQGPSEAIKQAQKLKAQREEIGLLFTIIYIFKNKIRMVCYLHQTILILFINIIIIIIIIIII